MPFFKPYVVYMRGQKLGKEAYENKKAYNREYRRRYKEINNLVVFNADLEANVNRELVNLLAKKNMTRKDFILWAYEKLKNVDDGTEK